MGGYGSGWHRPSKLAADHQKSFDVGWMVRGNPIKKGCWIHTIGWFRGGEETGSCRYRLSRDHEKPTEISIECLRDGQEFKQEFELSYQQMPKGEIKTYVICPYCQKRKLILYFSQHHWLCCRTCAGFTYVSCQESNKPPQSLAHLVALLKEETRWDREWQSTVRRRERCKEYRRRVKN